MNCFPRDFSTRAAQASGCRGLLVGAGAQGAGIPQRLCLDEVLGGTHDQGLALVAHTTRPGSGGTHDQGLARAAVLEPIDEYGGVHCMVH